VTDSLKSKLFVAGQFALLLLLVIWPDDEIGFGLLDFLFEFIGVLFTFIGLGVVIFAVRALFKESLPKLEGSEDKKVLTALKVVLPEPAKDAKLLQTGLYSRMRHPIYAGLIWMGYGIGIAGGPVPHLLLAIGLHAVLHYKSIHEEKLLAKKFRGYKKYAATAGRFFPRSED
jgi:protein-S-isoprenylcysteine O-methyltransferase Ste14